MKKYPFSLQLIIFTLITVFVWIGMDVYRTLSIKSSPNVPPKMLQPLNSELDTQTLDKLKDRVYLIDSEIEDTLIVGGEDIVEESTESATEQ